MLPTQYTSDQVLDGVAAFIRSRFRVEPSRLGVRSTGQGRVLEVLLDAGDGKHSSDIKITVRELLPKSWGLEIIVEPSAVIESLPAPLAETVC